MLGDIEPEAGRALRDLSDQGVSIVLVNSDTLRWAGFACIQAENYLLGRIMGEILLGRTPRGGPILVCAGEKSTPANADSTRGLNDYLEEHDANREIYALHYGNDMDGFTGGWWSGLRRTVASLAAAALQREAAYSLLAHWWTRAWRAGFRLLEAMCLGKTSKT